METRPLTVSHIFTASSEDQAAPKPNKFFRKLWASRSDEGRSILASFADGQVRQYIRSDSSVSSRKLQVGLTGPLVDAAWCPFKDGDENAAFVTACSGAPVQMWDANDGDLRASYRAYNNMGEPMSPQALCWSHDGHRVAAGYGQTRTDRHVVRFALDRTGAAEVSSFKCHRNGPVSSVVQMVGTGLEAIGLLEGQCVELADPRSGHSAGLLKGHTGGVTQVLCKEPKGPRSALGETTLITAARAPDGSAFVWDIRNVSRPMMQLKRQANTMQFIGLEVAAASSLGLDTSGVAILSGSTAGTIDGYLLSGPTAADAVRGPRDTTATEHSRLLSGSSPQELAPVASWSASVSNGAKGRFESQPVGALVIAGPLLGFTKGSRVFERYPAGKKSTETGPAKPSPPVDESVPAVPAENNAEAKSSESDEDVIPEVVRRSEVARKRLRNGTAAADGSDDEGDAAVGALPCRGSLVFSSIPQL